MRRLAIKVEGRTAAQMARTMSGTALVGLLLVGCAGTSPKVEQAQQTVERLRQDPAVGTNAPVALQRTEETLARLTTAADDGADPEEIDHLAYLVERRADATKLRATTVSHWQEVDQLSERREAILLQAESLEAQIARQNEQSALREAQDARQRAQSLQAELEELQAKQTDRGLVVTLGDLLFDVDGAELKPGGLAEVQRVAEALIDQPERQVMIEGHTDSTGPENYNLQLSEDRAAAVRQALVEAGVSAGQIMSRGYGESYPVATNDTQSGRQQNRRVELIIQDS